MRKYILTPFITLGVAFAFVMAMFAGSSAVSGQATPESDTVAHPAHIHAGVCPDVGDVVFPLEDVTTPSEDGMGTPDAMSSPVADTAMAGTPMADMGMMLESTSTVEAPLEDILAAEHAINLHMSADNMALYVACGDITGEADNGELVIDLNELNDSGVSGQATLTDNGDGTTTVVIEVHHVSMSMEGTPESTPKP